MQEVCTLNAVGNVSLTGVSGTSVQRNGAAGSRWQRRDAGSAGLFREPAGGGAPASIDDALVKDALKDGLSQRPKPGNEEYITHAEFGDAMRKQLRRYPSERSLDIALMSKAEGSHLHAVQERLRAVEVRLNERLGETLPAQDGVPIQEEAPIDRERVSKLEKKVDGAVAAMVRRAAMIRSARQ